MNASNPSEFYPQYWPPTRASLLARLSLRDDAAWTEFIGLYGPLVVGFIGRRLPHQDLEDVAQRIFLRLYRYLPRFHYDRQRGRFGGWLGKLIRNEVIRFFLENQRVGRTEVTADPARLMEATSQGQWEEAYNEWLLKVSLARLRGEVSAEVYRLFEASWVQGLSPAAAAKKLNVPAAKIHKARFKCLRRLEAIVNELLDDHPFLDHRRERPGDEDAPDA